MVPSEPWTRPKERTADNTTNTKPKSTPKGSLTKYRLFVSVFPNLEHLLEDELFRILAPGSPTMNELLREFGDNEKTRERFRKVYSLQRDEGGIELMVSREELWKIANLSRIGDSLRVRLGRPFFANNFNQLKMNLKKFPWSAYMKYRGPGDNWQPKVRAVCHTSKLFHSGAVEQRVQEAVLERLEKVKNTTLDEYDNAEIHIRFVEDMAQVSVDASGEHLHRRGYRTHVTDAPIRETLAASMLRAAELDLPTSQQQQVVLDELHKAGIPEVDATTTTTSSSSSSNSAAGLKLWDPFCGSGTFPIESASMDLHRLVCAEDNQRAFAFELWPTHNAAEYQLFLKQLREQQYQRERELLRQMTDNGNNNSDDGEFVPLHFGSDIDEKAIRAARENAKRCGFTEAQANQMFQVGHFKDIINTYGGGGTSSSSGVRLPFVINHATTIVTNPPYIGHRLHQQPWRRQREGGGGGGGGGGEGGSSNNKDKHHRGSGAAFASILKTYADFGQMLQRRRDLQRVYVVMNDGPGCNEFERATSAFQCRWSNVLSFKNGGIAVRLLKLIR